MEKLDKVIAGLRHCGNDAYPGECQKCPYEFEKDLSCLDALCNEAVEVIEVLVEDLTGAQNEIHALLKKQNILRAERDTAREKLARITGEREAAWLMREAEK
jgi:hypothetical protein